MFRGGQPYSEFRAVNCKDGRLRFEGKPFGVTFTVDPTRIKGNRKYDLCDATGSIFVKGYHATFGSTTVTSTMSLVPVGGVYKGLATVTGVLTTSIVLVNVSNQSTAVGIKVASACCHTAGYIDCSLSNCAGSTIANTALAINYLVLNPQTS